MNETIWSACVPLNRTEWLARLPPKNAPLPRTAGIYRVHRRIGAPVLGYVGQSQNIRRRVNELSVGVYAEDMPFTDPHRASPPLWAWARTPPYAPLTVSFAKVEGSAYLRQGLEDFIIALERWRRTKQTPDKWPFSPLVNFGKIIEGWRPSSSRRIGERGGPTFVTGPWHAPSIAPVGDLDEESDAFATVWGGHHWSIWCYAHEVPVHLEQQGLYRLRMRDTPDLWFLGHGQIVGAARNAARTSPDLLFSAVIGSWTYSEQAELLSDAIGLYVRQRRSLPVVQYGGEANKKAGNTWQELIQQRDDEQQRRRG